uniref:CAP-Gly domain-containing protein n=1 Tax=Caenorhabditis japonica TaxID=281687 RepID=A0A8R1I3S7_CAEJA
MFSFADQIGIMSEVYEIEITTNATDFPVEKKYAAAISLNDLKRKLELIVGTTADSMKIHLFDSDDQPKGELTDGAKSLKELGVRDGYRIHAIDVTGANEDFKDESMVEKYEMSEDAYDKRTDSVRAWKKKMQGEQGGAPMENEGDTANEEAAKGIKLGDRCEVTVGAQIARRGEIAFVGTTKFKDGLWVGVKYDEPVGKNDGSVAGVRYFECDAKYGGFVRPVDVKVGDYPELSIDEI